MLILSSRPRCAYACASSVLQRPPAKPNSLLLLRKSNLLSPQANTAQRRKEEEDTNQQELAKLQTTLVTPECCIQEKEGEKLTKAQYSAPR